MSAPAKALMLPRLLLGVGALVVSAAFIAPLDELLRAYIQIAAGLLTMIGALWLFVAQRRINKATDEVSRRP
jgi:HAMP domain-containing protein